MMRAQRSPVRSTSALRAALVSWVAIAASTSIAVAEVSTAALVPPGTRLEAVVLDPEVAEISGMTTSTDSGVVWVANDSGNGSRVFALGRDGRVRSAYTVRDTENVDWEDLTSFRRDGKSYLVIADTGDNGGVRKELELVVLEEPAVAENDYQGALKPAWKVRFRWPDGPRDCEAVSVDPLTGDALLLSKKRVPAQLFRLSLAKPKKNEKPRVAEQIGVFAGIPQPDDAELKAHPQSGPYRAQITAADVSDDGRDLVVLTYRDVYLYRRGAGESWRDALLRAPVALGMPPIVQAEAATIIDGGKALLITSEKLPAPLFRVELPLR